MSAEAVFRVEIHVTLSYCIRHDMMVDVIPVCCLGYFTTFNELILPIHCLIDNYMFQTITTLYLPFDVYLQ